MGFFTDLFSIARIKAKMHLRKLHTAEVKGEEIREKIKKETEELRKNRIEVLKNLRLFEADVEKIESQKKSLENLLLAAASKKESLDKRPEKNAKEIEKTLFDMGRINTEISTLEQQLVEMQKTVAVLSNVVEQMEEQAATFRLQADKAEQVIRISQTRYLSAKTLLSTNHGRLSQSIIDEIKDIERSADELFAEAEASREVFDADNKSDIETIKTKYSKLDQVSVEERLKKLKGEV